MRSLKIKKLEIKDPLLRLFRRNLRLIIKLAVLERVARDNDLSLYAAYTSSILVCSTHSCASEGHMRLSKRSTDLDMVWVPWIEKWVCINCFKKYYEDMTLDKFIESISEDPAAFDIEYMRSKFKNSFLEKEDKD